MLTVEEIRNLTEKLRTPQGGVRYTRMHESLDSATTEHECIPWTGLVGSNGYGIAHYPKLDGEPRKGTTAHRRVWELAFGEIPDGMQIDHACHIPSECNLGDECPHRRCINPNHLRMVTPAENQANSNSHTYGNKIKTHCVHGHEFTDENTWSNGQRRVCKACISERSKVRYAQKKLMEESNG